MVTRVTIIANEPTKTNTQTEYTFFVVVVGELLNNKYHHYHASSCLETHLSFLVMLWKCCFPANRHIFDFHLYFTHFHIKCGYLYVFEMRSHPFERSTVFLWSNLLVTKLYVEWIKKSVQCGCSCCVVGSGCFLFVYLLFCFGCSKFWIHFIKRAER